MPKRYIIQNKNLGTSPGTLTYVGQEVSFETKIWWTSYNFEKYEISEVPDLGNFNVELADDKTYWMNVDGIHEPAVIANIGDMFNLHPLVLEDILNTHQKPKFEYYNEDQLFVTLKMIEYNPYTREAEIEHLSFVMGEGYVISFQEERSRDIFEPILTRIKASAGKTRKNGADYLLYALIDLVVDNYFTVLDKFSENMEQLEEDIIKNPNPKALNELYSMKRELTIMRKTIFPLREMLASLIREEAPLITANTSLYLRDVLDHVMQVIETVDSYRDLGASLMDLYLSQVSNKMNNVMKVLTVISVIFMPLTFVAGIYGMNFDNMPELHWRYGYYVVWIVMVILVIVMLIWFKRKNWL
ncbi:MULTISPECIES: magnesium/cobalt transporter CorA [unclassified Arcicella]|uniref:magnesium/cobalt transporter CorA n=1 Tax=unclassified Arcicella TaxID=2644986 RepID=UPI00285821D4|nr:MULTISPECIES: magnesium/cobalt transporter CorA [unclassified Arcicella]MDR6562836.1 magnesium transporter [Arcicella sp. BE51]MDR6812823.1 magnesium transporter [Arcicella sp. BE140]MDR6824135.1 magnesium transporter [Arcicella sp. BE139]